MKHLFALMFAIMIVSPAFADEPTVKTGDSACFPETICVTTNRRGPSQRQNTYVFYSDNDGSSPRAYIEDNTLTVRADNGLIMSITPLDEASGLALALVNSRLPEGDSDGKTVTFKISRETMRVIEVIPSFEYMQ